MTESTITSAQAALRAAEVLERADCEPNPAMVEAKVSIAEGWTGLAVALAEIENH
ncbi:hypothetical protein GCM10023194_80920 [Planotetraspora phitsanulokensis]|uniref:Uncharacterized protein n=1 Tax=Planotetraspora phitsanulokensis TaxID=575192 RepID=A0A8J3UDT3_9ACTN|nr:hypothetical protein [Planotetraspora phitsanulokensis]GII42940.1 hypothetical protein Pph01_79430 [Planotetraspora phitsanulokensis]